MFKLKSNTLFGLGACLLLISFSIGFAVAHPQKADPSLKHISIIQNVEHPALNASRQGIEDELKNANVSITTESAQGNPSLAAQIAQKFVGNAPDVMVGIGTVSTQALVSADHNHQIPIVFCSVTDPKGAGLVKNLQKPEGKITGLSNFIDPSIQFQWFKKILPSLTTIGVIYNPGEPNSVSLNEQMNKIAHKHGLKIQFAAANTTADVAQAMHQLIGKVQAVFINNDNTALAAFDAIVKIGLDNKLPVFCSDTDMITHGALAVIGPDQYELGRQTGKVILQVLKGQQPNQIPVGFPDKSEFQLNLKIAHQLGIVIPESLIQEASHVVKDNE